MLYVIKINKDGKSSEVAVHEEIAIMYELYLKFEDSCTNPYEIYETYQYKALERYLKEHDLI